MIRRLVLAAAVTGAVLGVVPAHADGCGVQCAVTCVLPKCLAEHVQRQCVITDLGLVCIPPPVPR
jgi:hypothetical protein